jgi:hypothetical protein
MHILAYFILSSQVGREEALTYNPMLDRSAAL